MWKHAWMNLGMDSRALTCSLMYLYGSSKLSIFITDSFLTSTPDPIGKKRNTGKEEHIQQGVDAMRIQEWWNDNVKELHLKPWNIGIILNGVRNAEIGHFGKTPYACARVSIEFLKFTIVQVVQWCMNLMPKCRSYFSENFGILYIFFWFKMD